MTGLGFRRDWYPLIAGVLIVVAFELALIMWTTHGNFTYTLDDPYIHLALAENLARFGHYGINLEEYSSPSSSILWPLLLVPFLAIGSGPYGPLILNVPLAIAGVLVVHQIIVGAVESHGKLVTNVSWVWALFIFFAVNGFGVVFTGMEHSLHIFVTVSVMYFVNRMQWAADNGIALRTKGYDDGLLVLCIVLSPLIRFEGLAVSLFAVAMLISLGKPRLAVVSVFLLILSLASYFYAMSVLGLPWLPSSVLVKSDAVADVTAQADLAAKMFVAASQGASNMVANLRDPAAMPLLGITAFIGAQSVRAWYVGERVSPIYVAGVILIVCLHLAFGRFGWYARYQSYVCALAVCAALYVFSPLLNYAASASPARQERFAVIGILWMLVVMVLELQQSLIPAITTPIAAQNIYEQQRQMHQFVTQHWKAPVAVNDIGYVAFQNDEYVLDLWGLGSEEARRLRQARDPDMLRKLTEKHDVHLAMIYDEFFSEVIPADWQKVAELRLSTQAITPADDRVSFFVFGLDQVQCSHVAERLAEFARTLDRPQNLIVVDASACERPEISRDREARRATDS